MDDTPTTIHHRPQRMGQSSEQSKEYSMEPPNWTSPKPEPQPSWNYDPESNRDEGDDNGSKPSNSPSSVEAYRFALQDKNLWRNLLIGSVFFLIPIVGWIVLQGWQVEMRHRLAHQPGNANAIPKLSFSDFSHYLLNGMTPFCVTMIVLLPYTVLVVVVTVVLQMKYPEQAQSVQWLLIRSGIQYPLSFAMGIVLVTFLIRAELSDSVSESLSFGFFGDVWRLCFGTLLLAHITFQLIGIVTAIVGLLACCVGILPVAVLQVAAQAHLRAQLHQCYLARGGAPFRINDLPPLPSEANPQY